MVGYRPDGKPDRRVVYGKTRREVQEKLDGLRGRSRDGTLLEPDKERETVASYLTRWVETTKTSVRPKTWKRYDEIVRLHLAPQLGKRRLSALKPDHVQAFYAAMLAAEGPGTRGPRYSPRTVHHCHRVLHRALEMAVKWGYVPRNVCDVVEAPRVPKIEIIPPSPEELGRLFDVAETAVDRLRALWTVATYSGCRLGELLALQWCDLDLDRGALSVRRTLLRTKAGVPEYGEPKTARSRRTLKLPAVAMAALRAHRDRQAWDRQALGDGWAEYDLVFATQLGTAFLAADVSHKFKRAVERAGLPRRIRFHDLRHASATAMLRAGIHPKAASARLGHSTIGITMDLYSHAIEELDADAADKLEEVFRRARAASGG
jgi:integrase